MKKTAIQWLQKKGGQLGFDLPYFAFKNSMYSVLLLMPLRHPFFSTSFLTIILIDLFNDLIVFLFTELYCSVLYCLVIGWYW